MGFWWFGWVLVVFVVYMVEVVEVKFYVFMHFKLKKPFKIKAIILKSLTRTTTNISSTSTYIS